MFKTLLQILQGSVSSAEEQLHYAGALTIVARQIQEATRAINDGKRALALLVVQDRSEAARHACLSRDIAELEQRALGALRNDREDLARTAAEAIAQLESERQAIETHRQETAKEIGDLRSSLRHAVLRLANIERVRRTTAAAAAARRLRKRSQSSGLSALGEAEAILQRMRMRQTEQADVDHEHDAIGRETSAQAVFGLACEGLGSDVKVSAAEVLENLRGRLAAAALPDAPAIQPA